MNLYGVAKVTLKKVMERCNTCLEADEVPKPARILQTIAEFLVDAYQLHGFFDLRATVECKFNDDTLG